MTGRDNRVARKATRSLLGRASSCVLAGLLAVAVTLTGMDYSVARGEDRTLSLYHTHTRERATITFKRNGVYDRNALRQLNHFLRDWRNDKPTNMDPQLFDIVWEVYRQVGSREPVHIVSSYRSPETNNMLRRRSSGVAKNSLHMQGKAMDFFIPGVSAAQLRAAGLRVQAGGVGFYPTSGSPFVHLDTGTVRHWPRMSRKELVSVFPRGGTIHVPSDGKPLPGYQEALAAYKSRKASGNTAVASIVPAAPPPPVAVAAAAVPRPRFAPAIPASANTPDDDEMADDVISVMRDSAPPQMAAVRIDAPPMPRFAPRHTPAVAIAAANVPLPVEAPSRLPPAPIPDQPAAALAMLSGDDTRESGFNFGRAEDWSSPAVPVALAEAMAARDAVRQNASMPIAPTAIVATVEMSRPQRAAAITTAVLRDGQGAQDETQLMAFAALEPAADRTRPQKTIMTTAGVPMPVISPRHTARAAVTRAAADRRTSARTVTPANAIAPPFTMTALDTHSLRQWIGTADTRQRGHALMTMPDFAQSPNLLEKPMLSSASGFSNSAPAPRTDRFSNAGNTAQPRVIELTQDAALPLATARR